ncbi:MAG: hypothetical protein CBC71_06385 [Rhodobacteraceae bacterium TMED111]|nr:hypothetical protein [Marinovum sp.]MAI17163.1 hypothetical protein [Marinovum sp.]OUV41072.1 MAG: hypothetical protein CBC71_06105 [Rhodobacteraceae bacterium TMED111]OUV41126.1 MAG: hypothetical protein CBC71_06385 [Rhodobacteraceae bacterium TMED111]|tara:strand:+ start:292 stop:486 length:195 start_codon:yes stop_codon:yes gene_type:complete
MNDVQKATKESWVTTNDDVQEAVKEIQRAGLMREFHKLCIQERELDIIREDQEVSLKEELLRSF